MDDSVFHMAPPLSYAEAVASAVEAAIADAGTTLHAVAFAIGMAQPTLHRRLKSDPDSFKMIELDKIAAHLGVPVETLTAPGRAA